MECRSENVTQGPSPTGLCFIMSPAGLVSRGDFSAVRLSFLAKPFDRADTNAVISYGAQCIFNVATLLGLGLPSPSLLSAFPLAACQVLCLT